MNEISTAASNHTSGDPGSSEHTIVLLNDLAHASASISTIATLMILVCAGLHRKTARQESSLNRLRLQLISADFVTSLAMALGKAMKDELCDFQAMLIYATSATSVLLCTVIAMFLYANMIVKNWSSFPDSTLQTSVQTNFHSSLRGKLERSLLVTAVCWGLPMIASIVELCWDRFGRGQLGYCWIANPSSWLWGFYTLVIVCLLVSIWCYLSITHYTRRVTCSTIPKAQRAILTSGSKAYPLCNMHMLTMILVWTPRIAASVILLTDKSLSDYAIAIHSVIHCSQGLLDALVFGNLVSRVRDTVRPPPRYWFYSLSTRMSDYVYKYRTPVNVAVLKDEYEMETGSGKARRDSKRSRGFSNDRQETLQNQAMVGGSVE